MIPALDSTGFGLLPVTEVDPGLLQSFQCGKPHLDLFLQERAPLFHVERLCYAWVVVHADCATPVAYFTLNNDALELATSKETDLGLQDHVGLTRFPAVNIGRLAVDQTFHKTGVSQQVMALALDQIRGVSSVPSAARLVVVDAANEASVIRYYERHGFLKSLWAEKQALHQGGKKNRTTIKMLRDILVPW
jgi:predicted GNAT family N-acyltransferase